MRTLPAISSRRWNTRGSYILAVLAGLNFFNYANRTVVLSMYDELRAAFGLSDAELGLLTTAFMLTNALIALPAGWAADRFDRRRVIAFGALVWSAGSIVVALADVVGVGLNTLVAGRLLAGLGSGALVPVGNALLCDVFPPERKARTVSIFNIGLVFGGVAGFGAGLAGYPTGIWTVAVPPVFLALLAWNLGVSARRRNVAELTYEQASWLRFSRDVIATFRLRTFRRTLLGAILISFSVGGYSAWFVDFVVRYKGMDVEFGAVFFGIAGVVAGLGGVLTGGAVGDWLMRRVPYGRLIAISFGLLFGLPCASIALFVDGGPIFLGGSTAMLFFLNFYHGPMAAVVDDLVPDERAATAQASLVGLMHLLGTAPSAFAVGLLADQYGLREALILPTVTILLAAAAFALGCPTIVADTALSHPGAEGDSPPAGDGRGGAL